MDQYSDHIHSPHSHTHTHTHTHTPDSKQQVRHTLAEDHPPNPACSPQCPGGSLPAERHRAEAPRSRTRNGWRKKVREVWSGIGMAGYEATGCGSQIGLSSYSLYFCRNLEQTILPFTFL